MSMTNQAHSGNAGSSGDQKKTGSASTSASSIKMLRAMVGIGAVCALMIVLTFEGTKSRIAELKAEALEQAIFKVLPGTVTKATYFLDDKNSFSPSSGDEKEAKLVYAGFDAKGELIGIAIEASGIGFADVLRILYGYDPATQTIIGFYVLDSKETPGLGDKIEKDPIFLANFTALNVELASDLSTLKNAVVTVKSGKKENDWEIDGITGATISSRAIGDIMESSTKYWMPLIYKNKDVFQTQSLDQEKTQK
jgi:electron transport complex protein RnfG